MKIKITNVNGYNNPYSATNKQGKAYTIYQWTVNMVDENKRGFPNVILKSFEDVNPAPNSYYTVKEDTYNGVTSYMIQKGENKPWSGRPGEKKVPFEKIATLATYCIEWVDAHRIADDNRVEMFNKVFACAGVSIDWDTISPDIDKKVDDAINNVNNVFNGEVGKNTTGYDDDVPF